MPESQRPATHVDDALVAPIDQLDHHRAPLVEAVCAYLERGIIPFSTPGHKGGRGMDPAVAAALGHQTFLHDLPLAGGVDNLRLTGDVLGQAERLAADAFGADRTIFLVNGSTISNQVALLSVAGPGDEVVMARNIHKSMQAALVLSGSRPVYVYPRHDAELEIAHGVVPEDLAAVLDAHPRARAAVVVSPTYFGVTSDTRRLADLCHERGLPLIVDEAWGAHLPFHPDLPDGAMACGADAGITSIHKLLSGITQASVLNVRSGRIDIVRVETWAGMLQTTSPAALILASIDGVRRQMVQRGPELLQRTLTLGSHARAALNAVPGLAVLGPEVLGRPGAVGWDPTVLVIDVRDAGLSGYEAETWLRLHGPISLDLSDHRRVIARLTIGDDEETVGRLIDALRRLVAEAAGSRRCRSEADTAPQRISLADLATESLMTPREAAVSPARYVPLAAARGRVAAGVITPYPPGIPVLAPGERITPAIVEYLTAGLTRGMYVSGIADAASPAVRVVQ
jgi:arginine/lysine/ornithine decarboxylase